MNHELLIYVSATAFLDWLIGFVSFIPVLDL